MNIIKMTPEEVIEHELNTIRNPPPNVDLDNPEFDNAGMVHDWRNYVPYQVVNQWARLSKEERAVVVFMAQKVANEEEWD